MRALLATVFGVIAVVSLLERTQSAPAITPAQKGKVSKYYTILIQAGCFSFLTARPSKFKTIKVTTYFSLRNNPKTNH